MRNYLLIILLLGLKLFGEKPDSLKRVLLNKNLHDSERVKILTTLSVMYEFANVKDTAEIFENQAYRLSLKTKNNKGIGDYFNYIGRKFYYIQSYDSSIFNFRMAAKYYEIAKSKTGISSARNNIAAIYTEKGEIKKSIAEYRALIDFTKKNNDTTFLGNAYSNLGNSFMSTSANDSAIHYITLASRIHEKKNINNALSSDYYNLAVINENINQFEKGLFYLNLILTSSKKQIPNMINKVYCLKSSVYANMGNQDSADFYIKKAIASCKESGDKLTLLEAYNQHFKALMKKEDLVNARATVLEAIKIGQEIGSEYLLGVSYNLFGSLLVKEKKYEEAVKYYKMEFDIALKNNSSAEIMESLKGLAKSHTLNGDFKVATMYLDSIINYKNNLNEQAMFKNMKEIEVQFETEKKDLQIQKGNSDLMASKAESKRKSVILITASIALIVTLFFALIALVNFRKAKKANTLVQSQNKTLEQKNHEVELQKNLVLEKQKEIISSINYAKKIQSAVLTGEEVWKRISKEYFILFKPKDIVSGDFYWAHVLPNGRAIFALADCTGHGVPGGFMSMLGNSFLNELVVENKIFNAAAILNKLREKIIKALDQKGNSEQKDGMDIVLCVWNKMDNTLEFAGANNNLYFVRDHKTNELKGNKMPIGTYVTDNTPFTSQTLQLQKGDCIYLTTDGFADQFGGPHGKKYKYKQMEDVLLTIHDIPMDQQAQILEKELDDWKNELEQVDDICVLGIRV